nr:aminotransferase [Cytophagales bacterium]
MIKFLDLQNINRQYALALKTAAAEVIDSGWYLRGTYTKKFEEELAIYQQIDHVVGVGNGLDALTLIFRAYITMGFMKEGDEIIVPAHTFIATVLAITENRLKPVFVDTDPDTWNMALPKIEACLTPKTKAIVVVHLYGRICWDETLSILAKKHRLKLIEDNAQAIGAELSGTRSGSLGDVSAFSFYPGKLLGALGDAGAVVTNDAVLSATIRELGNYGGYEKFYYRFQGVNSRMDELQAAFLSIKLKHLPDEIRARRAIAVRYLSEISNPTIFLPEIQNPSENSTHVWHIFSVLCSDRTRFQEYLSEHNIETGIHYPTPPYLQDAFPQYHDLSFPETERISHGLISLPIYSTLSSSDIEKIILVINEYG